MLSIPPTGAGGGRGGGGGGERTNINILSSHKGNEEELAQSMMQ